VAGVDLGICNPAAVVFPDDALLYPGNRLCEDKHYFQLPREEHQTEGSHAPSRTAEWARENISRRKDHFLHALSKNIAERCVEHDIGTLVVGDLSGVDEDDWGRQGNKRLANWAYKRLMNLLDYKAVSAASRSRCPMSVVRLRRVVSVGIKTRIAVSKRVVEVRPVWSRMAT